MKLSAKLLVLTSIVSLLGFGGLSWLMLTRSTHDLVAAERGRSEAVAASLVTGIQNIMLTGKGVLAEELVHDLRRGGHVADLRVYDREGIEVYLPREKRLGASSEAAAEVLRTGVAQRDETQLLRPLESDASCATCHSEPESHRGALSVELKPTASSSLVAEFVNVALTHVMLSGEASEVAGYLERLGQIPEVKQAYVLDPEAKPSFGAPAKIPPALEATAKTVIADGTARVVDGLLLTAVPNDTACHVCHGDDHTVRGVIAVETTTTQGALVDVASALLERSIIQLMLSERGNQLDGYLREVRTLPSLAGVHLFDHKAQEVYPPAAKVTRGKPAEDARVFSTLHTGEAFSSDDGDLFTAVVALPNDIRCQACHGSDHPFRGAVRVQADLRPVRAAIRATTQWAGTLFAGFALLSAVALFLFVRRVLVSPVLQVSNAARRVGEGDLSVELLHRSRDEVGDLSRSMNDMIVGLRGKLMMQRFVGDHTRRMIEESVSSAGENDGPVRRAVAVLFSDVRGFTSYSEKNPAERVIATLNVYLGVQTECVERHGGYVDKFVGDEVMAIFEGEDREYRAICAANDMLQAVVDAPVEDRMTVGIGINSGEVVFGATGSRGRQDYTAIGDVVNLAARLCGAAPSQAVLITDTVRQAVGERVAIAETSELQLKGKALAVRVHRVAAVDAG